MDYDISHVFNEEKNAWEVKLTGEFDVYNSTNLKAGLNGLIEQKNADIILDCGELKYMDSTALGSLVAVLKNVKAYEGRIVLKGLKPSLLKLFKITNLNKVFEIEGELDESI